MRRPESTDPVTRWLDAERDGRVDDAMAEAVLLELFESLPPLAPSAGFADRVLQRIALPPSPIPVPVPVQQSPLASLFRLRWFRLAVASCLLATGISLLWLPQTLAALAGIVTVGDMVQLGVASMVDLGRWLGVVVRVGEWFLTVGRALAVSMASPAVIEITVGCLAISGLSFVVLRDLMTRDRSWSYVDSIR
ncbi:MAG TPA: hypothetical protein VN493_15655 [Thermoanaerobaculia bacterium]|nr:hypothetical protein [Thermoanaerobaculia bacterium]